MRLLAALIAGLAASVCLADGPPIDSKGEVTVDHIVLVLSESQIAQVGQTRSVTLLADQHSLLEKLDRHFPKDIYIITPHYHDCTCELPVYGIWTRTNQVAIPLGVLRRVDEPRDNSFLAPESPAKKLGACGVVIVDISGRLYSSKRAISETEIEKALPEIAKDKDECHRVLFLNLPPDCGEKIDKPIRELVNRLQKKAAVAGVEIVITG